MTNSTQTNPTILTDRKDMAEALNYGKYKVLTFDGDSKVGIRAAVMKKTRSHGDMKYAGELCRDDSKGTFYLLSDISMLSAHISAERWLQFAEVANCQVINEGDEVAILVHSLKFDIAYVQLVRALKPSPGYSSVLNFENI